MGDCKYLSYDLPLAPLFVFIVTYPSRAFVPVPLATPVLPPFSDVQRPILCRPTGPCLMSLCSLLHSDPFQGWSSECSFPLYFLTLSFYCPCHAQHSPDLSLGHFCIYIWKKITHLEKWYLANPWQQMQVIKSFTCLRPSPSVPSQPASSVPEGKSCLDFPGKKNNSPTCLSLCIYFIWIGFPPLEIKRLLADRINAQRRCWRKGGGKPLLDE